VCKEVVLLLVAYQFKVPDCVAVAVNTTVPAPQRLPSVTEIEGTVDNVPDTETTFEVA
jgi:hypothetical protein